MRSKPIAIRVAVSAGALAMLLFPLHTGAIWIQNPVSAATAVVERQHFLADREKECAFSRDPLCRQHFGKALLLPVECNPYYITNCDNSALEWQSVWREDRAPWTSTEILEAWREVFASILWPLLRDMAMGALGGFAAALSVCWGLPAYWRWLTARSSL